MKTLIEQLKNCPAKDFFPCLRHLCEENGYPRYLIDFSLSEAVFFISGSEGYFLLCVAFSAERGQKVYIDSLGYSLDVHSHCVSPMNIVKEKRDKLEAICKRYQLPALPVFMGVATEYGLLNSEKEREQWYRDGISFVAEGVNIPCEENQKFSCYSKYFALSEYLSARR